MLKIANYVVWTRDRGLFYYPVMACGVLGRDGQRCAPTRKPDFLFPVQALSKVFRGKFMAALAQAHQAGCLERDLQGAEPLRAPQRHQQ